MAIISAHGALDAAHPPMVLASTAVALDIHLTNNKKPVRCGHALCGWLTRTVFYRVLYAAKHIVKSGIHTIGLLREISPSRVHAQEGLYYYLII